MVRYKFIPNRFLSKQDFIKNLTINNYGYYLTNDYYLKLCDKKNRSIYFDNILCNMTKDYFIGNNNEKNLHRWSLENREKTKYEKNYPW